MVPDHGFARVGTMQVQAITPKLFSGYFLDIVQNRLLVNSLFDFCFSPGNIALK